MKINENLLVVLDTDPGIAETISESSSSRILPFTDATAWNNCTEPSEQVGAILIGIGTLTLADPCHFIVQQREAYPRAVIILMLAVHNPALISTYMRAGADDFICKPLNTHELKARLLIHSSHTSHLATTSQSTYGDIVLDQKNHLLSGPYATIGISPLECLLLAQLINAGGSFTDKSQLKKRCWTNLKVNDNAFHRKIHALRNALKQVSATVRLTSRYRIGFALSRVSAAAELSATKLAS